MRCNLVLPKLLTDQHLFAEYRELKMIVPALRRSLKHHTIDEVLNDIPSTFTLGKGHMKFWYNKLLYLSERHRDIQIELINRQYNFKPFSLLHDTDDLNSQFFKLWTPTNTDLNVIQARIVDRIQIKLNWYRYYGVHLENVSIDVLNSILFKN
jgi:deoxyribonuclease (pyrimidine dimer)